MSKKWDCSGWATRADMLCSDGRTIRKNAFEECDGQKVPVVWNHDHSDQHAVLGHALLKNRDEGVYAYISFNNTEEGNHAKELVLHKDIDRLSIFANRLRQMGGDVIHGEIKEVSLVLAGANPGAIIDSVIAHGDESYEEAYIRSGDFIEIGDTLEHSDDSKGEPKVAEDSKKTEDKSVKDVINTLTPEQKKAVAVMLAEAAKGTTVKEEPKEESKDDEIKHSDEPDSEKTVADVLATLNPEQEKAVNIAIAQILEDAGVDLDDEDDEEGNEAAHSDLGQEDEGGDNVMKHNVFDKGSQTNDQGQQEVLQHDEFKAIVEEAKRRNSTLKDAFLAHGITSIETLFPDPKSVTDTPMFIKREDSWVSGVINKVHRTPYSRIKSVFADITEDEARAKGYVKGALKKDEVFKLLKRVTVPTTVYKKQSIDRDDIIDITDFNVMAWLKEEMRGMLMEELARAILFGDGRGNSDPDKINEQNIRPIWTDDDMYTVKIENQISKDTTGAARAKAFIRSCIKSRKEYKGSGNPSMFISEDMLTECLLLEDKNERVIYDTEEKLRTALRVKEIISVPVMENLSRVKGSNTHYLDGMYVNLIDYNVGTDKGGEVVMYDDFDIDYNKQKYLTETHCGGALIKPYAAVVIESVIPTSEVTEAA
nr:HK97 family phage prohead protease [uncultured Mediterraneibacter sp.]